MLNTSDSKVIHTALNHYLVYVLLEPHVQLSVKHFYSEDQMFEDIQSDYGTQPSRKAIQS